MDSPDSLTRAPATLIDNADKLSKDASPRDVFETSSICGIDSSDFPELPEPSWSKYVPSIYSEKRVLDLSAFQMKWSVQVVAGIAVLFFGFGKWSAIQASEPTECNLIAQCVFFLPTIMFADQGVMSDVNESKDYLRLMGTASGVDGNETQRDSAAIGGIVAIYYLGTLFGGLLGGYMADSAGRMKTIFLGSLWVILGASLQASAQNITWMMFARVITGCGTGIYNDVVPVWVAELSKHDKRGQAIGFEFVFNILGLALVYWLSFGVRNLETGGFNWRFPLAFQLVFVLMLLVSLPFFPESPRWLAKMGRVDEARRILARLRSTPYNEHDIHVAEELQEILDVAKLERIRQENGEDGYIRMIATSGGKLHIRRRIVLAIWLQILQELAGIGVITVYAPTVFRSGGFNDTLARLLSGFNDVSLKGPSQMETLTATDPFFFFWSPPSPLTGVVALPSSQVSYMFPVFISVFTLDLIGRRKKLFIGNVIMGVSLFIAGVAAKYALQYGPDSPTADLQLAKQWGAALATMIFIYTAAFGGIGWLCVPWLYPTEIFPSSSELGVVRSASSDGAWAMGW